MACYQPIPAYQDGQGAVRLGPGLGTENLALPCGKCIGCRTTRATQWARRCQHEATMWEHNCFLTLTYADERLPENGHLQPKALQLFIKRLRRYSDSRGNCINRSGRAGIRYFGCGEYGDNTERPHYHLLLFNCQFGDGRKVTKDLYTSEAVAHLWPDGHNRIGELTPAAASYVAQYNLKKIGAGDFDRDGVWRPPPFLRMSLKPAIGAHWLQRYYEDLQHGYLVNDARKEGLPRYYKNYIKKHQPELHEQMLYRLQKYTMANPSDRNEPARLRDSEKIHKRKKELTERRTL